MRTCAKCHEEKDEIAFGRQVYCRSCWRTYNNERQKARRRIKRTNAEEAKQGAILAYLAAHKNDPPGLTNNQKRRLDTLKRLCEECVGDSCTLRERVLCPMFVPVIPAIPLPPAIPNLRLQAEEPNDDHKETA